MAQWLGLLPFIAKGPVQSLVRNPYYYTSHTHTHTQRLGPPEDNNNFFKKLTFYGLDPGIFGPNQEPLDVAYASRFWAKKGVTHLFSALLTDDLAVIQNICKNTELLLLVP